MIMYIAHSDFDNVIYYSTVDKEAYGARTPFRSMNVDFRSCL